MTKLAVNLLIRLLAANGRAECDPNYRPAKILVEEGYAKLIEDIDGIYYLEINRWMIRTITNGEGINYRD